MEIAPDDDDLDMLPLLALAAAIVGKAAPVVTALVLGVAAAAAGGGGGGGTSEVDCFDGSSKEGGGNTGLELALPVPEGPPPPTFFRGAPLTALSACCSRTICC